MTAVEDVEVAIDTALGQDDPALVARMLSLMTPEAALLWLQGSEPFLGGARPVDVLALDGSGPPGCLGRDRTRRIRLSEERTVEKGHS
ncbi:hypothetical protein [Arthrobacter bambusae]|uniref:hypothetical protein n=1 Tax=Arthrobacter bambusae TaxID=1338426 RepID=UPI00278A2CCD|nr:hypothetical protein [Arthrobacter bambusae]MDQ0030907.1 hypothetical protein [Arthrobacter bambusae]MDQ0099272.1 hypothetical protein [Arthrobacter bambusae]